MVFSHRPLLHLSLLSVLLLSPPARSANADLEVETDFPGGSAQVLEINPYTQYIRIQPKMQKNRGWACWWYFKVSGIDPSRPLHLDVGKNFWSTPDRASYSLDGKTWKHSKPGERTGTQMRYQFHVKRDTIWIAWGPPFVHHDAEKLIANAGRHSSAEPFVLCTSRGGHKTHAIRITDPRGNTGDRPVIWVHARQHAWEVGSSWVAKGLIEWLVSNDPKAQALRREAEIVVVPIMDVDNVVRGAGGKNQIPHDHNRDWTKRPHWKSVAKAQKQIKELDKAGRLEMFIDLHCPGATDRFPYYYIPPSSVMSDIGKRNLNAFLLCSRTQMRGPLRYLGRAVESGANYDPKNWKAISKNWVAMNCQENVVSVTLEVAWNTPSSTVHGYQTVGKQLGLSMGDYMGMALRGAE